MCEPALEQFGWIFFLEILRNIESIYKLWKVPPSTVPSKEFLNLVELGMQIRQKCIERMARESAEGIKATRQKAEQEIADGVKARLLGDIIYEYAFTDLEHDRGKPSKLWETFCLTALSEHLRESTPDKKPYFSIGAWFLSGKPSKNPSSDTKRIRERVRQFKQAYPNWPQQLKNLKRELMAAKDLVLP
jgi:hypothetical protein